MEQFLIDNADRYKELVQAFNPKPAAPVKADSTNPDFLVSTRIRPLLPDEISQGFLEGVCSRPGGANIVDLHELKKSVRGLPCLNVSHCQSVLGNSASFLTRAVLQLPGRPRLRPRQHH